MGMRFKVDVVVDGKCSGEVIIIDKYISFFGEVDPFKCIYKPLEKKLVDKVMVFRGSRGSTVGSYIIYGLKKNNCNVKCMLVEEIEPILVAGAVLANIPLLRLINYNSFIKYVREGYRIKYMRETGEVIVEER